MPSSTCCALIPAWLLLSACATSHQAIPSETSLSCDGAAAGVTFCVEEAITPAPGAVVTANSIFRVNVRYHVPGFRQGEWSANAMFATTSSREMRSGPLRDRRSLMLSDSAGVLERSEAFGNVWHDRNIARPFRIYVTLIQGWGGVGYARARLGPFVYNDSPLLSQGSVAALVASARAQLDSLNVDSARVLLAAALAPSAGASQAERVRGLTLLGIAHLTIGNRPGGADALREAILLEPSLQIDTLVDLQSDLLSVFAEVLNSTRGVANTQPLSPPRVRVYFSRDTILAVARDSFEIQASLGSAARLQIALARAETPSLTLWSRTIAGATTSLVYWNLRSRAGPIVDPGSFVLRFVATDSTGRVSAPLEQLLEVSNVVPRPALYSTAVATYGPAVAREMRITASNRAPRSP